MTRKLGTVGDINPIEFGGGYIVDYEDDGPVVEHWDGLDQWPDSWNVDLDDPKWLSKEVTVYRVNLCIDGEALLADLDWVDFAQVSTSCGYGTDDPWGKLATAQERANLVVDVAGYWGWDRLDPEPMKMTLGELIERWRGYA